MKKREIGIRALLVILGISIGIVIGVLISKQSIHLTTVREGEAVATGAAAQSGKTPEFHNAGHNAG